MTVWRGFFIGLSALLLMPILFAPVFILDGIFISILWSWFIVPFFDVPQISILQAIGFSLIVNYFRAPRISKDDGVKYFVTNLTKDLITMFIALIVHLLM